MALCESQLQSAMHINGAESTDEQPSPDKKREPNGDIYVPPLPLSVDYRSPVSHFVPPAVELYAARHKPEINVGDSPGKTARRQRGDSSWEGK
ncbi:jg4779 [Pararge aegeria aegeria]|uniref:Jg4779 protein n=1 Tax=Pararge aegeria aegeria TaxID=348720 RepID=A0A8S4QU14_9NEOP|nr:jg4779 [Pararge aegeria aegeria]